MIPTERVLIVYTSPVQTQFTCIFGRLCSKGPSWSYRPDVGCGGKGGDRPVPVQGGPKPLAMFHSTGLWLLAICIRRRNPGGTQPRYYLSNAPGDTPLETQAGMGGSRWGIETEFETERGDVRLDEYQARSWAGCIIT